MFGLRIHVIALLSHIVIHVAQAFHAYSRSP